MFTRRALTFVVVWLFAAALPFPAFGQGCPTGQIETSYSNSTATGVLVSWQHPPGFGTTTLYEIINDYAPTECDWLAERMRTQQVVVQTTGTQFQITFGPPDSTLCYSVRVAACPLVSSQFCAPFWNYTAPPAKPNLISATASGPAQVTITYSHPDDRTPVFLERAGSNGVFNFVQFPEHCPGGSTRTTIDYGQPGSTVPSLPPGTYQYRLVGYTERALTYSDIKTVVVGGGSCVPPQVAPQISVTSTNVLADAAVILNWATSETPERFRIEMSRNANFSDRLVVAQVPGRERSATIRFPGAGQFFVRVAAVNVCGRRDSQPVSFNVSPAPARVVVTAKPSGILQVLGENQTLTDSYSLANLGGTSTFINLQQVGTFFTQSPTQFTLAPGASQTVSVTATAQSGIGNFSGTSVPTGSGVPPGSEIPIRLVTATRPNGDPVARANTNRVDLTAAEGGAPSGSIDITNTGTGSIKGFLVSNVPWLIPIDDFVNLAAGTSETFRFRVDRVLRANSRGSEVGTLILVYMKGTTSSKTTSIQPLGSAPPPGSKATLVTVTDTVKPPIAPGAIPPIADDEIAYFVPGVGHVVGGGGTSLFISDVTILNSGSLEDLKDIRIYLVPGGGSGTNAQVATINQLSSNQTIGLADVTKSVFNSEGQVGSLQIRTKATSSINVNANILNIASPTGTYGTSLPVFRSTNAIGGNEKVYLTGLRKDPTGRTNIYLQEMAGLPASVQIEFLNAAGSVLSTSPESVQPFALTLRTDAAPQGAAAAVVTNTSSNGARVLAHATPVDQATGDTWSVTDWSRQYGYARTESVVVPVAGKLRGALNADFRTDVAIMNTGTGSATGTLRYYQTTPAAQTLDRVVSLGALQSQILGDVVASLFGLAAPSAGYLVFTPNGGASFVLTSRTYTLEGDGVKTFGTGVPALATSSSLEPGETFKIAGLEDAGPSTVVAGTPGTYRTNLGLAELDGQTVTVRATIRYTAVQGAAAAVGVSTADIVLQPRQLLIASSITSLILGANRALFGDLRDIQVDFEIVGAGRVMVFTTSTDNGTNDTALRIE